MRFSFTKLFRGTLLLVSFLLTASLKMYAVLSPPASCTVAISNPANGASHYMTITWSAVTGATAYQLEYSADNYNWVSIYTGSATTFNHNAGSSGNVPVYYHVLATQGSDISEWKNASNWPIYTACNNPALPLLYNSGSTSMYLQLAQESPTPNPAYTTYAVYCPTTGQFLQSDGTLGATEIFNTSAVWDVVAVTGLTSSTSYCFYAKAKNMDGDIRFAPGSALVSEAFDTDMLVQEGNTSQWSIPRYGNYNYGGYQYAYGCASQSAAPGYPRWKWTGSSGCSTGGAIYYQGDANWGYEGCLVNAPVVNLAGLSSMTVRFNLTNNSGHPNDYITFSMWAGNSNSTGTYVSASKITINGVAGTNSLYFNTARSCEPITVTFNLTTTGYSNSYCSFQLSSKASETSNSSAGYYALVDDISLGETPPATACLSTTLPTGIYNSETIPGFSIYPNPVGNVLSMQNRELRIETMEINNVFGQTVLKSDIKNPARQIPDGMDVSGLSPGIYFFRACGEKQSWTGKFVKE